MVTDCRQRYDSDEGQRQKENHRTDVDVVSKIRQPAIEEIIRDRTADNKSHNDEHHKLATHQHHESGLGCAEDFPDTNLFQPALGTERSQCKETQRCNEDGQHAKCREDLCEVLFGRVGPVHRFVEEIVRKGFVAGYSLLVYVINCVDACLVISSLQLDRNIYKRWCKGDDQRANLCTQWIKIEIFDNTYYFAVWISIDAKRDFLS